jgi:hypothetical protein
MKIHYIILLGVLLILNSCQDPTKYFSEQRSNLVGEWLITSTQRAYNGDVLEFESEGNGSNIILNEDGTGSRTYNTTIVSEREFEWLYQLNTERILIYYPRSGMSLEATTIYDITNNTASYQSWEREWILDINDINDYDRFEYEYELTKL